MLERFAPHRVAHRARREAVRYAQVLAEAPYQFHDFMEEIRDGQIEVGFVHKGLDDLLSKLDTLFNRLVIALIVVGGLIGSSIIGIFATTGPQVLGDQRDLDRRLRVLRGARDLAPLGRRPQRPAVERSSRFSAKGHLAEEGRRT